MLRLLLVLSIALNVWLASVVVRLESFHDAVETGACRENASSEPALNPGQHTGYLQCLEQRKTRRTSWFHLAHALGLLGGNVE